MLSIEGGTYTEVFANLSANPELDDRERNAASKIAAWFVERDRLAGLGHGKADDPDYDPLLNDTVATDHARRAPFFGDTSPEVQCGRDYRTWIHGDVRFTVKPYTTGNTMNVGVDRAHAVTPGV